MARAMVTAKTYRSRSKVTRASQAVKRAMGVLRARNARLRKRNVRTAGFLGIENKFYDTARTALSLTAPTNAAGAEVDPVTVNTISAPAQGDGESNRDGRCIKINSIHINGNVFTSAQSAQSSADEGTIIYIALIQDMQTNGAQLNSEDVFTNPGAIAGLAANPFRDLQYSRRFKVLAKKVITLINPNLGGAAAAFIQNGITKPFMFNLKCNIPVNFTATTEGVSSVADNSLHLVAYCSDTTTAPQIRYNSRIRFVG